MNSNSKVIDIEYIGSKSGNPGCTNGKYDVEYSIIFDDGSRESVFSCRCGNGCNGSFPIAWVAIGKTTRRDLEDIYDDIAQGW